MNASVAIVDTGGANIASLRYAFARLGVEATLCRSRREILKASHVVLPGVGAAADAMNRLRTSGLDGLLRELRAPVLGICLGMQLLAERSAEGDTECLGVLPGAAARLSAEPGCAVPNMGWSPLQVTSDHPLLNGLDGEYFYFVHSYALPVGGATLARARHADAFAAAAGHGNFLAVQFHPERSAAAGARLLQNFLSLAA